VTDYQYIIDTLGLASAIFPSISFALNNYFAGGIGRRKSFISFIAASNVDFGNFINKIKPWNSETLSLLILPIFVISFITVNFLAGLVIRTVGNFYVFFFNNMLFYPAVFFASMLSIRIFSYYYFQKIKGLPRTIDILLYLLSETAPWYFLCFFASLIATLMGSIMIENDFQSYSILINILWFLSQYIGLYIAMLTIILLIGRFNDSTLFSRFYKGNPIQIDVQAKLGRTDTVLDIKGELVDIGKFLTISREQDSMIQRIGWNSIIAIAVAMK